MRSSSDKYLAKVDHLRAFAAFQVFVFHFLHQAMHCGVTVCHTFNYKPYFTPLALLDQGQTGVSLFMCLSGYIFAYLTHASKINPLLFSYNRLLRVVPLIVFWSLIVHLFYQDSPSTGVWSVYIELEYYAFFPILHIYMRPYGPWPLLAVAACLFGIRLEEWWHGKAIQELAYYTIAGRGDQLLLGSVAFYAERWLKTLPKAAQYFRWCGITGLAGICIMYQYFGFNGGYAHYPAHGFFWVISPLLDGVFYSLIIVSYLQLMIPDRLDRILRALGKWAYSIYLDQFFFIPFFFMFASKFVDIPANLYVRMAVIVLVAFPLLAALSAMTYTLVERPFLRFRKNYIMRD